MRTLPTPAPRRLAVLEGSLFRTDYRIHRAPGVVVLVAVGGLYRRGDGRGPRPTPRAWRRRFTGKSETRMRAMQSPEVEP